MIQGFLFVMNNVSVQFSVIVLHYVQSLYMKNLSQADNPPCTVKCTWFTMYRRIMAYSHCTGTGPRQLQGTGPPQQETMDPGSFPCLGPV